MIWSLKTGLGVFLGFFSFGGFVINLIAIIPVARLAFLHNKSPIYVISFVNLLGDVINVILTIICLVPSIILETFLFSDSKNATIPKFLGFIFMFCWYLGSITQILMAINRMVVIYLRRVDVFTRRNILLIFSLIVPFSIFLAYMAQYGFTCCPFVLDHTVLSYSYVGDDFNYPNYFIDLPLNFSSSFTSIFCYSLILYTVHKSSTGIKSSLSQQRNSKNWKKRELTYAMHFCLVSMFYTFSWITFRLFPIILKSDRPEWFIVIPSAVTINSSANAFIYLMSNKEVRNNLKTAGLNIFKKISVSSDAKNTIDGQSMFKAKKTSTIALSKN